MKRHYGLLGKEIKDFPLYTGFKNVVVYLNSLENKCIYLRKFEIRGLHNMLPVID